MAKSNKSIGELLAASIKKVLNEKLELKSTNGDLYSSAYELVKIKLKSSLESIKTEIMDNNEIIDNMVDYISGEVDREVKILWDSVANKLVKSNDDSFKRELTEIRAKLESSYKILSRYFEFTPEIEDAFDDLLYSDIDRDNAIKKIKFLINKLASEASLGYEKEIIKAKNEAINNAFKKIVDSLNS